MARVKLFLVLFICLNVITIYFNSPVFCSAVSSFSQSDQGSQVPQQDIQLLYNGRVWRSLYYNIRGDEFLFSKDFIKGNVTINGKTFNNIDIKYDIYNDEIISFVVLGTYIQLNKEMVTGFDLIFNNIKYKFTNITGDSTSSLTGYANVLYQGKSALYLKFRKEIKELAVDNKYDAFIQRQSLYVLKGGVYYRISGKKDFYKVLKDKKSQIRDFVGKENIKVRKKKPESFVPVLEYYDSLNQ
jgi:hypothetical protein